MGQLFWVFLEFHRHIWNHAQIWRRKLEFPEIAQNHNCRSSLGSSGSPEHEDTLLFKSDKK